MKQAGLREEVLRCPTECRMRQSGLFYGLVVLAVGGPALSFAVLAHDLLVLAQDAQCMSQVDRSGTRAGHAGYAAACGVECKKLCAHPRAIIHSGYGAGLNLTPAGREFSVAPGWLVFGAHGVVAAACMTPLVAYIVRTRRAAADDLSSSTA